MLLTKKRAVGFRERRFEKERDRRMQTAVPLEVMDAGVIAEAGSP
jgi:hypothetical protein